MPEMNKERSVLRQLNMYRSLMVPLDGSALAETAISYAEGIAKRAKSKIILFSTCAEGELSEHEASIYLGGKVEELRALRLEATQAISHGAAADEILNFSEKNRVDLIIISTHGYSGISRWVAGSVCNKVIYESYVPVLLVKTGPTPVVVPKKEAWSILVPLDGSELSEVSLIYASDLANKLNGKILLFLVEEAPGLPLNIATKLINTWGEYIKQIQASVRQGIQKYLNEVKGNLEDGSFAVSYEVGHGRASEEILKYAESYDIDLIAMTTHGSSGFGHWAYGSVASKVIHGTSKPVLLIRPRPNILDSALKNNGSIPDGGNKDDGLA